MKKLVLFLSFLTFCIPLFAQHNNSQIPTSINEDGSEPDSSALLDLQSTKKGILLPRMTKNQRLGILNPAEGLLVFDMEAEAFYYFFNNTWINLSMPSVLQDSDGDTRVEVEVTSDDDFIWFTSDSIPYFRMRGGHLETYNSGASVIIGAGAGPNNVLSSGRNVAVGDSAMSDNVSSRDNVAIGYKTLHTLTEGEDNTAIGSRALSENEEGEQNTAVGARALSRNRDASQNTAVGENAMRENTSGDNNTALGTDALNKNTIGDDNTAIGESALYNNKSGRENTATGKRALQSNFTGRYNTANGYEALRYNIDAYYNSALGYRALRSDTAGSNNTAIGAYALENDSTGSDNTSAGFKSLRNNTSGSFNTAIGFEALYENTKGTYNTAGGWHALYFNQTGQWNTGLGRKALYNNIAGINNTGVGNAANSMCDTCSNTTGLGYNSICTASNQIRLGNSLVESIGGFATWSDVSDQIFKKNISEDVYGLDFILNLRPINYDLDQEAINQFYSDNFPYDSNESIYSGGKSYRRTGFIAQEVEQIAKDLGFSFSGIDPPKNGHDFYSLRYATFVVPLVKAVQEQQGIIEAQMVEIKNQDNRLMEIEAKIEALEKLLAAD